MKAGWEEGLNGDSGFEGSFGGLAGVLLEELLPPIRLKIRPHGKLFLISERENEAGMGLERRNGFGAASIRCGLLVAILAHICCQTPPNLT